MFLPFLFKCLCQITLKSCFHTLIFSSYRIVRPFHSICKFYVFIVTWPFLNKSYTNPYTPQKTLKSLKDNLNHFAWMPVIDTMNYLRKAKKPKKPSLKMVVHKVFTYLEITEQLANLWYSFLNFSLILYVSYHVPQTHSLPHLLVLALGPYNLPHQ